MFPPGLTPADVDRSQATIEPDEKALTFAAALVDFEWALRQLAQMFDCPENIEPYVIGAAQECRNAVDEMKRLTDDDTRQALEKIAVDSPLHRPCYCQDPRRSLLEHLDKACGFRANGRRDGLMPTV